VIQDTIAYARDNGAWVTTFGAVVDLARRG
jgi:hypothetical protein